MFTDVGKVSRLFAKREVEITGAPLLFALVEAICNSPTARATFEAMPTPPSEGQLSGWLGAYCSGSIEASMEVAFGDRKAPPSRTRLIVKLGSDESPSALHPERVVMFIGDRWLAKRGLLPMALAFEENA